MPTTPVLAATAAPLPPSAEDGGPFAEGDLPAMREEEGLRAQLHWVSLDARTGRLLCPSLSLEAAHLTGRITEKRLVRVFTDGHGAGRHGEEEGGALCASSDRRVADHGRPGRECAWCEDLGACTPRWRVAWEECGDEEPGTGLVFAHTLSAADTVRLTRYALALRREGLRLQEVLTRISTEELIGPGSQDARWRLRFEKADAAR